jgi:SAM-dependent methyltransferase
VRHVVADVEDFEPTGTFDAVIGRYFLMYVTNPESIVRKAAQWLRPGGSIAFIEMDLFRGAGSRIWPPPADKTIRAIEFIGHVMIDAGTNTDMAARLPSMLSHYGEVHAEAVAPIQFGAMSIELPIEAVRSVQPIARKLGRQDAYEYDVDALLADELSQRDAHTVTIPPLTIAAWVRI